MRRTQGHCILSLLGTNNRKSYICILLQLITMQKSDKIPKVDDPFKLVMGILSHLKGKKTSVQLQHEAKDLWAKKYLKNKNIKNK